MDIIGVGEVVVDCIARVDHFPAPDEKVNALSQTLLAGGVTANYCVAAARLGARTGFVGAVGKDAHGQLLIDSFLSEGVDISALASLQECETPLNFIAVDSTTGEKTIIQSPFMQTTRLSPSDLWEDSLAHAKVLHTSAIHHDVTLRAVEIAKKHGVWVSMDLESQIACRGWENLEPILSRVDLLMPNKQGALTLTRASHVLDAAEFLVAKGIPLVVVTLGKDGCLIAAKNTRLVVEGFRVNAVDTTGAGDTFAAAFDVAHAIRKMGLKDAARFANAAAALSCRHLGARTGMPTHGQVVEFLDSCGNLPKPN